jgi:siroheme decarboxylase
MKTPLPHHLLMAMESDLPCESRPYQRIAEYYGMTEVELLNALREGIGSGLIRRYGARVRHQSAGYTANVMVVWQVTDDIVDDVAVKMTSHPAVSHCYMRPSFPGFPYSLYTMVHGRSREECEVAISELAQQNGLAEYETLWTAKEYKKTTPCYSQLLADV